MFIKSIFYRGIIGRYYKKYLKMELQLSKIFVGNVPFQCSQSEFSECFEKMDGFIKAEIVCKCNMEISRGFGFVTFDSPENAKKIIGNNSIQCKDRILRFTEYGSNENKQINEHDVHKEKIDNNKLLYDNNLLCDNNFLCDNNLLSNNTQKYKNFLMVKNVKNGMTRETLCQIFEKYGQIGRHFIVTDPDTGNLKSHAIVEVINQSSYDFLIKLKELKIDDSCTLEISKWKQKNVANKYNLSNGTFNKTKKAQISGNFFN